MTLFKRVELGQENVQSKIEILPFSLNYEISWKPSKKCNHTNKHMILILRAEVSRFCQMLSAARRMNTSQDVLPGRRPMFQIKLFMNPL